MPYIKQEFRKLIDEGSPPCSPGPLNYKLTTEIKDYLDRVGHGYDAFNEVLGVLTAIQHELYRRMIAPFEDKKIEANGDIF